MATAAEAALGVLAHDRRLEPAAHSDGGPSVARSDGGFTLVEVLVAMVIGVILIVGLTLTLTSSLRSVNQNRTVEQATAIAIEQVEFARSLAWDELLMDTPATGDPRVAPSAPSGKLLGTEVGLPSNEPLVIDTANGRVPYETLETLDTQDFAIHNYVTEAGTDLRRLVVVVDWTVGGTTRSHQATTLIAEVAAP